MSTRILHCSTSIENYNICIEQKVAGFLNRGPQPNDLVYLVVKVGRKTLCGARFKLDAPTDFKPWPDGEKYVHSLRTKDIEYCQPFDISILSKPGGKYWSIKYIQSSKPISDKPAYNLLDEQFSLNRIDHFIPFRTDSNGDSDNTDFIVEDEPESVQVLKEVPDAQIVVKWTFQTVPFTGETDILRGLEPLVNKNFHALFPQFPSENAILIPENRLFKTEGIRRGGNSIQGISSIPDGLLIIFNKKDNSPIQIHLIEYECFGEKRVRESEKTTYLNSTVIPQLMRFASAFSTTTEQLTRESTIRTWTSKIIDYVNTDKALSEKVMRWMKELNPNIRERSIDREIDKLLALSLKNNLKVTLIIDELSAEQKSMINNVINSFKLDNGNSVQFSSYVVKLVQGINNEAEEVGYALTVQ